LYATKNVLIFSFASKKTFLCFLTSFFSKTFFCLSPPRRNTKFCSKNAKCSYESTQNERENKKNKKKSLTKARIRKHENLFRFELSGRGEKHWKEKLMFNLRFKPIPRENFINIARKFLFPLLDIQIKINDENNERMFLWDIFRIFPVLKGVKTLIKQKNGWEKLKKHN
jgi:hypothetical protein